MYTHKVRCVKLLSMLCANTIAKEKTTTHCKFMSRLQLASRKYARACLVGLGGLCQHNLEHNRALQASSIMRA